MIPACNNGGLFGTIGRLFSTALCMKQRMPLMMGELLTTWFAHRLEYLDQGLIAEAHCFVELKYELCVPKDLCSHFVLVTGALQRSKHAA